MATLEELTPGARVGGILPGETVTVVQAEWHGTSALTLTYRSDANRSDQQLVYRDDEARLSIDGGSRAFSFDGDGKLFRLAAEAMRINLAYLFDPHLAVHTSSLEPLPHQIQAVYGEMLTRQPLRYLLADDPGAGKTIMTGLLVKELIIRGDVKRCMIVVPGSLIEQWQDELWSRFGLAFTIISRDSIENALTGNPFTENDLVLARIDQIARDEHLIAKVSAEDWDLIVVDEAHKMSAHYFGNELKETKRYKLGRELGACSRHLLFLTATPHSGKEADFQLFMALLDADRFEGKYRDGIHMADPKDMMRRLIKENLLRFDGKPLFPERRAYTVEYKLSDLEARLYAAVTDYVREEMERAAALQAKGEGRRGAIVGFALTTLQRRLASSPEAIFRSLSRRLDRLEKRVKQLELIKRGFEVDLLSDLSQVEDAEFDEDDLSEEERERLEQEAVDEVSAATSIEELRLEIVTLTRLVALAEEVRRSGTDRKWEELREILLNESEMFDGNGVRRKIIVFSEHKDTLNYLRDRIGDLLGRPEAVVTIHGGMGREARKVAQESFTQDKDVLVLVATDAAGEGINLQRAHLLVNYDLPWNPNRIEQRFGRIHRIGQTEVCHMWNLVAVETREGDVFKVLLEKLERQRAALGGQVFDVLGQVFTEHSLRELLLEAVRYGDLPETKAKLDKVVGEAMDTELRRVVEERALSSDILTVADVERIRDDMALASARRLQPHFVRAFFTEAFRLMGGSLSVREPARYEITHVPGDVRARDRQIGHGAPVLKRYERVTFDKELVRDPGGPMAEFICPGHPLLDATVDLVLERHRTLLKQGTVLVDDADEDEELRVLLFLEHAIQDARTDASGARRVISRRLEFVEMTPDGAVQLAGHAPYLDYRAPDAAELGLLADHIETELERFGSVEQRMLDFAIAEAVPAHLEEVRARTIERVAKTKAAVKERLTKEINHWDHRAHQLRLEQEAGKQPKMNWEKAQQRADELHARLERRLAELDEEQQLSPLPPTVVGGALVVPAGLLARLRGERREEVPGSLYARERDLVERIAVAAAMQAERDLGRVPTEMPRNHKGFDILSRDVREGQTYFIEVKGRVRGAETVTITKSEILTSLNERGRFRLALVEVEDETAQTVRYVTDPFRGGEEALFGVASVNFDLGDLMARAGDPV